MVYLGIDYGKVKVGLAISEGFLAQPLTVLRGGRKLFFRIAAFCQEQRVDKIVVGLPEGVLEKEVREFGAKLAELVSLPVEFHPETLTTRRAIDKMIEAGKGKKARKEKEDSFAAALILNSYLESISLKGKKYV